MTVFKITLNILLFSFICSCGKIKEMNKNAEAAKDNSGLAAHAAQESREEIANSRMISRASGASDSRRKALNSISKMTSFSAKVVEANKFVQGFEFQYWTGQRYDTLKYLHTLYTDAMREFFASLAELNNDHPITNSNLNVLSFWPNTREKNKNIAALAVAMHKASNVQTLVTVPREDSQSKPLSIYELIKQALKNIKLVEMGTVHYSDLLEHEQIVYNYKNEALAMIQIRLNMYLTMALFESTNVQHLMKENPFFKINSDTYYSNFEELNLGKQSRINTYLSASLEVKMFLDELGEEVVYNDDLKNLYTRLDLTPLILKIENNILEKKSLKQVSKYLDTSFHFF